MHEPPSEHLVRQLTELQLCLPRDLHRARGRVRRLSFDLPAFDSVWIDSLVQLRLLTPFQAKLLESGQGESLRIGSLVAIDELGRSSRGSTYLARRLNRRDQCVVKRLKMSGDRATATRRQLTLMLEHLRGFVHPQLVVPHEILTSERQDEIVLVSRFIPGLPLNDLLVRRGRFPATVVLEIGRQLLEGLAALHSKSLVHGDIRLSNIRLTDSGLAVLVNGAIRPIIDPQLTIHDGHTLDRYDGIAPELIGTGAPATAASELYSLGCVLWQLLTGRPPFISADPLAKLAAHQTRLIEDVRAWAPDTPSMLAESIRQLTSSSPNARPRSFQQVLQHWGQSGSFGRSRLRQFRRLFNGPVPHFSHSSNATGVNRWFWIAASLIGITAGGALIVDHGLRSEFLNIPNHVKSMFKTLDGGSGDVNNSAISQDNRTSHPSARDVLTLPAPTPDGLILLKENRSYAASSISHSGPLIIRAEAGAEILVGKTPLSLSATEVTLERVRVKRSAADPLIAMVIVRSEQFGLLNCTLLGNEMDQSQASTDLHSAANSTSSASVSPPAIAWKYPTGHQSRSGVITIRNSAFHGNGTSLRLAQTPASVKMENILKTGEGPMVVLGSKTLDTKITLTLERVTLRASGPLLKTAATATSEGASDPSILISASNCVFQPTSGSALMIIDSGKVSDELAKSIAMTAIDSVVEPGTILLAATDPNRGEFVELDADEQFDGLVASEIRFAGPRSLHASDSKTLSLTGPRTAEASHPGIDPMLIGSNTKD